MFTLNITYSCQAKSEKVPCKMHAFHQYAISIELLYSGFVSCNIQALYIQKISCISFPLRRHTYSNTLKVYYQKKRKFSDKKNSDIFQISAQNIDCGYSLEPPRRGGSNEYHNLCFSAEITKIVYTPVNPSFSI